jgi:N-hydroxyarylamine O-acetyltransferase
MFVIRRFDDGYFEVAKKEKDAWRVEYIFKPLGRDLSEFSERCDFQQYSPNSHFTKGKLCSLMTETGRKTLTDKSFIATANGERTETPVESEAEFDRILEQVFQIVRP